MRQDLKIHAEKINEEKEIIVAFNKSDLLSPTQLELFDRIIKETNDDLAFVNKISCARENIDELLNQLKIKLKIL